MTPIALLVDDSCPLIHVYRNHWADVHKKPPFTDDGRRLLEFVPNEFLSRFCDVVDARGIAGKFTVVPAPAGVGDIVDGIAGFPKEATKEWNDIAKSRLGTRFDFCPEMITHNFAIDLATMRYESLGESDWSQDKDRVVLTPYIARALKYLKDAGYNANGVTSPWVFGIKVEPEYVASIAEAQLQIYDRAFSWYFLHMLWSKPETRPWVALQNERSTLISIPATVADHFWHTINCNRTDDAYVSEITDKMLTSDGESGQIRDVLNAGGWPIVLTHWQSLFSNGLETGLRVLDELGRRVESQLLGEVTWMKCSDIAALVASL